MQDAAGGVILHARAPQHQAHEAGATGRAAMAGDPADADAERFHHAGMDRRTGEVVEKGTDAFTAKPVKCVCPLFHLSSPPPRVSLWGGEVLMRRMLLTFLLALGAAWGQAAKPAGPDLTKHTPLSA